jgi:hypothetical protein
MNTHKQYLLGGGYLIRKSKVLFIAVLLGACTTNAEQLQEINANLMTNQAFVLSDIESARKIAIAHDDVLAEKCYDVLYVYIETAKVEFSSAAGAITAYQKARTLRRKAQAGLPDDVRMWCGALVSDSRRSLTGIASELGLKLIIPGL